MILLSLLALAQAGSPGAAASFAADCADHKFMGAVSIARRGEIIFDAACGSANAEWDSPNTADTKFRAASIAKQFTATAVLLLQEQGKLSVTTTIGEYIDGLPEAWRSATVHQLLTHTSGIPIYTEGPLRTFDRLGATPRELLGLVQDKPLLFPHGTRLEYNNTGYILLGMLIEKVSGMTYAEFVQRRLFDVAGMQDSGFDEARRVLPRRASGYRYEGAKLENVEPVDASVPWSAGGFYSTTRDLVKWASAIRGGKVLRADSKEQMFRVYRETALQGMHYGYGIVIAERFGKPLYYHGGGISGFSSVLQMYPDLTVAVMSNLDSGATPSWTVADHLAANYLSTRAPLEDLRATVAPLPGEDILQPCEYRLAPTAPETKAVWVIFDRGQDYLQWFEDPKIREFARDHKLALMLAAHCRSRGREDIQVDPAKGLGRALFAALDQFAGLKTAPVIAMGWSGAGSLAARLAGYRPERYLAGIAYAPGQYEPLGMDTIELPTEAIRKPQLIVANGGDYINGTERPYGYFKKYFDRGAPWTFAVQNRTPHCCLQNAQALILAWIDGVLASKAQQQQGFLKVAMSNVTDEWKRPVFNATSAHVGDAQVGDLPAGWMPSGAFAAEWLEFVQRVNPLAIWRP